jgi:hypothetical protein
MSFSIEARNGDKRGDGSPVAQSSILRRGVAICATTMLLAGSLSATEHVVPRARLHDAIAKHQSAQREDRAELMRLLSRPEAKAALASAGMEFRRVEQAVATLDEETASRLAERARQANQDFAAGALSNQMLTYIVIALGTAIIVLIAVS